MKSAYLPVWKIARNISSQLGLCPDIRDTFDWCLQLSESVPLLSSFFAFFSLSSMALDAISLCIFCFLLFFRCMYLGSGSMRKTTQSSRIAYSRVYILSIWGLGDLFSGSFWLLYGILWGNMGHIDQLVSDLKISFFFTSTRRYQSTIYGKHLE